MKKGDLATGKGAYARAEAIRWGSSVVNRHSEEGTAGRSLGES